MRSACRRRKTGTCSGEEPRYPSNVRIEREVEEEKGMTRRHPVYLLFEHDLRANAFRVCREGKPVPTFPDHALFDGKMGVAAGRRWRPDGQPLDHEQQH